MNVFFCKCFFSGDTRKNNLYFFTERKKEKNPFRISSINRWFHLLSKCKFIKFFVRVHFISVSHLIYYSNICIPRLPNRNQFLFQYKKIFAYKHRLPIYYKITSMHARHTTPSQFNIINETEKKLYTNQQTTEMTLKN